MCLCIVKKFFRLLDKLLEEIDDIDNVKYSDVYRNFLRNNVFTFEQAIEIDTAVYEYHGSYLISEYNFPSENDEIVDKNGNFIGIAMNIGLLTFDIY